MDRLGYEPIYGSFAPVDVPTHDRHGTYNRSIKGVERNARSQPRRNESKRTATIDRYLSREFVSWDGEGLNESDGTHSYVLLANSDGDSLCARSGLSTVSVFEMFLRARDDVTHIIYGGGYDVNMILKDLDRESLDCLYDTGKVRWNGYRLEWRGGKSFSVRTRTRKFLLYDVLPFFQTSFVNACDEYLGKDWSYREEIIREKANRGSFTYDQIEGISEYNRAELATLVRLANELRQRLHKVEIRVKRWDGPGAVASALYTKYGTKSRLVSPPEMVAEAARHAYAGGRFEIIRKGHSESAAYQYDIRSAYPSALRNLPCLAHGEWVRVSRGATPSGFGVYRVEVVNPPTQSPTQPQPLWMRNKDGTVYFTEYAHGWYWSPEASLARELGGSVIHEGWELVSGCDCAPFSFVEALYNKRAALKKAGDGAHVGLKLGLNSLYGKLAQQIGWDPGPPLKLPPYHSLEWAGYVTSHCRAQIYRAAMLAPDDVIAFETDAIFSRVPLVGLRVGERLGEWDETVYTSLTYLKSGMYFATLPDGKDIEKSRGITKGSLARSAVVAALTRERNGEQVPPLPAQATRFITLGQALHQDYSLWTHWVTGPREIQVALDGKRIDLLNTCDVRADKGDGWQNTQIGFHDTTFSHPYEVEWISHEYSHPDGRAVSALRKDDSDVSDHDYA